ncbi:hypothetical protein BH10BAC3_BH10BAC3_35980 [soil metagenome]
MKKIIFLLSWLSCTGGGVYAQTNTPSPVQQKAIAALIDQYSEAREQKDTALLKTILTEDVDQLVSTGEWRSGIRAAIEGMLKSSATSPGARSLMIDKIRMLRSKCAVVDCRYEIANADNTVRKMWSSFIVIADKKTWKIIAIRNMLPTTNH